MAVEKKIRNIVVGDIHGCFKTLSALLFAQLKIVKSDNIYFLGDYIDRGPSSKQVVDLILKLRKEGYKLFPIMGNHEKLLLESTLSNKHFESWVSNGCETTLKSFGIRHIGELEEKYLTFFSSLPYFIELDDFFLCHGGMDFEITNPLDNPQAMPWMRNDFVDVSKIKNKRLIVGHTPKSLQFITDTLKSDKIMLDGGCVYSKRNPAMGYLCALELNSKELSFQFNIDM